MGAWLVSTPYPAQAHSALVDSSPHTGAEISKAPQEVTLTFNENIGQDWLEIVATTEGADPVSLQGKADGNKVVAPIPAELQKAAGHWIVAYRVVSADGHPVEGSIEFTVGESAAAQQSPTAVGQATSGSETAKAAEAATPSSTPVVVPEAERQGIAVWWLVGGTLVVFAVAGTLIFIVSRMVRKGRQRP